MMHRPSPRTLIPTALRREQPDANGIRAGLVARVRELIEQGAYDEPSCWAEAEDRLFDAVEQAEL